MSSSTRTRVSRLAALAALLALPTSLSPAARETSPRSYPETDRRWASQDYTKAYAVLTTSLRNGGTPPSFRDPEGRAFLGRLTDADNLAVLADTTLPLSTRMPEMLGIMGAAGGTYKLYRSALLAGQQLQRECAAIYVFMMRMVVSVEPLATEFMRSLPPDDPKRQVRRDGLEQMRRGFQGLITGAFWDVCQEHCAFGEEQQLDFLLAVRDVLPSLVACMDEGTYQSVATALDSRRKSSRREDLRQLAAESLDILHSGSPGFPGSALMTEIQRQCGMLDKARLRIEGRGELLPGGKHWTRHASREGGFSVELPGMPVVVSGDLEGEEGGAFHALQLQDAFQVKYVAVCVRRGHGKSDDELLEELVKGRSKGTNDVFANKREIESNGRRGYEFRNESATSSATGRLFVVDGKTCLLAAESPRVTAAGAGRDVTRFLGSFRIDSRE